MQLTGNSSESMKNYYHILGVTPYADQESIKKAFRDKAPLLHPEKNASVNAKEEFSDLIEAYEILSKPNKRSAYDAAFEEYNSKTLIPEEQEVKREFEQYEKEARKTSRKYKEYGLNDFLALEIFVGMDVLGDVLENGIDLLDEADDLLGDLFDLF